MKPSSTEKSPSTITFSLMLTDAESSELMVVPPKASPAMVTLPAPLALILMSSLVFRTSMLLLICC